MLGIVQSAGATVQRRPDEVPSHTEFLVHGEAIRTSVLSETSTLQGKWRVQQELRAGAQSPLWGKGGERVGSQGKLPGGVVFVLGLEE